MASQSNVSRGSQPPQPAALRCPKCGSALRLDKYKGLIDLGVDGVRDVCQVCGTFLTIAFDQMTAEESS